MKKAKFFLFGETLFYPAINIEKSSCLSRSILFANNSDNKNGKIKKNCRFITFDFWKYFYALERTETKLQERIILI